MQECAGIIRPIKFQDRSVRPFVTKRVLDSASSTRPTFHTLQNPLSLSHLSTEDSIFLSSSGQKRAALQCGGKKLKRAQEAFEFLAPSIHISVPGPCMTYRT